MNTNRIKNFIKYSSLNTLGMIGISFYILADTYFVSAGMGTDGLAALNIAIPVYSFIHGSGLMIGMGAATRYSLQKSAANREDSNRTFTSAVYLGALFACIFVICSFFFAGNIAQVLGAQGAVYEMTEIYMKVILLFSPAFILNNILLCFVRNDGSPQLSMTAMIAGSLSNIVLDWMFIFPFKMGIFGAAFATGISPVISMAILSVHFIKKRNGFSFFLCRPSGHIFGSIISCGIPSLVTELSSGIVIIIFNIIILKLSGNVGVAAYGVIANISLVIMAVFTGMAQGIQPIVSLSYGMKKYDETNAYLRYAVITVLVLSALIYAVVYFMATPITSVFNSENDVMLQIIAEKGLKLYFTACPFAGFNIVISIFLSSTHHRVPAQIISLMRGFLIIIPMAFLLSHFLGINGIWITFPATEALVCLFAVIITALLFRQISKKHALD